MFNGTVKKMPIFDYDNPQIQIYLSLQRHVYVIQLIVILNSDVLVVKPVVLLASMLPTTD